MRQSLLFAVVLAACSTQNAAAQRWYLNQNGDWCGPEGSATSAMGKALNRLKNRYAIPTAGDFNPDVTLAAMLEPGDDRDRWSIAKAATIAGWVVSVKAGGRGENCNCKTRDLIDCDTHIDIALTRNADPSERVVVEVTPRLRRILAAQGVDWSTSALKKTTTGINGKWVVFTGWMFFDGYHVDESENTNPGDSRNWRATAWEIHPVTAITISEAPEESPVPIDAMRTRRKAFQRRVEVDPQVAASMKELNRQWLASFDPGEIEAESRDKRTDAEDEPAATAPIPTTTLAPPEFPVPWISPCPCEPWPQYDFGCKPHKKFRLFRGRCRR